MSKKVMNFYGWAVTIYKRGMDTASYAEEVLRNFFHGFFMKTNILVTGAGGFIGHHMVKYLKKKGYFVRGCDIKHPSFEPTSADEFFILDLREKNNAIIAVKGMDYIYHFAANLGGIGFLDTARVEVQRDNVLMTIYVLEAMRKEKVQRLFFPSSACVYPKYKQNKKELVVLKESDVYPADPENEYGWEKLFSERLCMNYSLDYGIEVRIARFQNIFGPLDVWEGGREKSIAALCKKIAMAKDNGSIEIWGTGEQKRSYCYIDDCVEGVHRLMMSDVSEPLNIGALQSFSINDIADMLISISGKHVQKKFDLSKPQGVLQRSSDNTRIKQLLHWEPSYPMNEALKDTYDWVHDQVRKTYEG